MRTHFNNSIKQILNISKTSKNPLPAIIGVGALAVTFFLPDMGGIGHSGWVAIGILAFTITFWAAEVLPTAATSMAVLVLLPTLGVLGYSETFSHLGTVIIWRLIAIFFLTAAVRKVGLGDRVAYRVMLFTKGRVVKTLFWVLLINFLLGFIIPNSYARTVLCVTVVVSWLEAARVEKGSNIGKAFMIAIPISGSVTLCATIIGASVDIFAAHMFLTLVGFQWTYVTWMIACTPFCLVMILVILVAAFLVFPPETRQLLEGEAEIRKKLEALGPMRGREWFVLSVFSALLVFWFADVSELFPAEMLAACLLIFPHRFQALKWKESVSELQWDILLVFGASVAMAAALVHSGVVDWLSASVFSELGGLHPALLVLLVCAICILVRLGVTHMIALVSIMLPLLVTAAQGIGINPVWLGMICVISSCPFFFPAQSPNTLFAYKFGYFKTKDLLRFGGTLLIGFIPVIMITALLYWPYVILPIWA